MEAGGTPAFVETLATLPRWTLRAVLVVLGGSVLLAAVLLTTESFRGAGQGLLVLVIPLLTTTLIVLGASHPGTGRIDHLTERFLVKTVADKLRDYLVDQPGRRSEEPVLSSQFTEMSVQFDRATPSWCRYRFEGNSQGAVVVTVKCNVLNFEVLVERVLLRSFWPVDALTRVAIESHDDLDELQTCPAVAGSTATLRGSLHEGYAIAVDGRPLGDRTAVVWRFRQKLAERMILSPVMRRYFAEDAAVAIYFLCLETAAAS